VRDARLWHALFGVEKTIVEAVGFDGDAQVLVGRVRPARTAARAVECVNGAAGGTTRVREDAAGGRWIWARCRR
jgi:hypothetical protein